MRCLGQKPGMKRAAASRRLARLPAAALASSASSAPLGRTRVVFVEVAQLRQQASLVGIALPRRRPPRKQVGLALGHQRVCQLEVLDSKGQAGEQGRQEIGWPKGWGAAARRRPMDPRLVAPAEAKASPTAALAPLHPSTACCPRGRLQRPGPRPPPLPWRRGLLQSAARRRVSGGLAGGVAGRRDDRSPSPRQARLPVPAISKECCRQLGALAGSKRRPSLPAISRAQGVPEV